MGGDRGHRPFLSLRHLNGEFLHWNASCRGPSILLVIQSSGTLVMDSVSKKIGGAIDKVLCEAFEKRERALPAGRYVSFCFDDFPRSAALNGAPMLEQRDWRATWYVAGGFLGSNEEYYGAMFEDQDLLDLARNGHDFGSHTFDHLDCRAVCAEELDDQFARNDEFLRARGIEKVRSFAYPFGAANMSAKKHLSGTDLALRGVNPGINKGKVDLNLLKAVGLQKNNGGIEQALSELDALGGYDGWLIIFTHDVRDLPSDWGVTPSDFETVLSEVEANGANVVTVGDMFDWINEGARTEPVADAA